MSETSVGIIRREERLKLEVFLDEAEILAPQAKIPVAEHGRFVMAASAGRTTRIMLRAFADKKLPWERIFRMLSTLMNPQRWQISRRSVQGCKYSDVSAKTGLGMKKFIVDAFKGSSCTATPLSSVSLVLVNCFCDAEAANFVLQRRAF